MEIPPVLFSKGTQAGDASCLAVRRLHSRPGVAAAGDERMVHG